MSRKTLLGGLLAAPLLFGAGTAQAQVVVGDAGQSNSQSIGSNQTGADSQNSTNNANNAQSLGSLIVIGDASQRNRQSVRAKQTTEEGVQNSSNTLNNAQIIAVDVIIGDRDQDNHQTSTTDQTQETTDGSGSTITVGDLIEISVDDDLPSVGLPGSRSTRSATRAPTARRP